MRELIDWLDSVAVRLYNLAAPELPSSIPSSSMSGPKSPYIEAIRRLYDDSTHHCIFSALDLDRISSGQTRLSTILAKGRKGPSTYQSPKALVLLLHSPCFLFC